MAKRVGLHLRVTQDLKEVVDRAIAFELPFFQCFLSSKDGGLLDPTEKEQAYFLQKRHLFSSLFLHASYRINLSGAHFGIHRLLKQELLLAKKLAFTHVVIHPGAADRSVGREEGIVWLARALNRLTKSERELIIVIENTAHGKKSIGGALADFKALIELLDFPEKIQFCLDTAHAYSFGYDLASLHEQSSFIDSAVTILGKERIALIHLNDTSDSLGSKIDRHEMLGKGNIGEVALRNFVRHPFLKKIPIIMELPIVPDNEMQQVYTRVVQWDNED